MLDWELIIGIIREWVFVNYSISKRVSVTKDKGRIK